MIDAVSQGRTKKMDVGLAVFQGHDGKKTKRYFINIADMGIGGETVARVNRTTKAFGGFVSFLWGTLATLVTYRPKKMVYSIDGKEKEEVVTMIVVANGRFFGGGMHIAPTAMPDDGLFDVVVIREAGLLDFLKYGSYIYKGEKIDAEGRVEYLRAKKVEGRCDDLVYIDVDGEQPGVLPASFEIIPSAINFVVP